MHLAICEIYVPQNSITIVDLMVTKATSYLFHDTVHFMLMFLL